VPQQFDVLFEKLNELVAADRDNGVEVTCVVEDYEEIEEIRRFTAELNDPEPLTYTTV
jgi:hypothetical protein